MEILFTVLPILEPEAEAEGFKSQTGELRLGREVTFMIQDKEYTGLTRVGLEKVKVANFAKVVEPGIKLDAVGIRLRKTVRREKVLLDNLFMRGTA